VAPATLVCGRTLTAYVLKARRRLDFLLPEAVALANLPSSCSRIFQWP